MIPFHYYVYIKRGIHLISSLPQEGAFSFLPCHKKNPSYPLLANVGILHYYLSLWWYLLNPSFSTWGILLQSFFASKWFPVMPAFLTITFLPQLDLSHHFLPSRWFSSNLSLLYTGVTLLIPFFTQEKSFSSLLYCSTRDSFSSLTCNEVIPSHHFLARDYSSWHKGYLSHFYLATREILLRATMKKGSTSQAYLATSGILVMPTLSQGEPFSYLSCQKGKSFLSFPCYIIGKSFSGRIIKVIPYPPFLC